MVIWIALTLTLSPGEREQPSSASGNSMVSSTLAAIGIFTAEGE
jgi:hypothetical protein